MVVMMVLAGRRIMVVVEKTPLSGTHASLMTGHHFSDTNMVNGGKLLQ
jgi:hypothetical protein